MRIFQDLNPPVESIGLSITWTNSASVKYTRSIIPPLLTVPPNLTKSNALNEFVPLVISLSK